MAVVTATPAESAEFEAMRERVGLSVAELEELERQLEDDRQRARYLNAATLNAIDAVNIFTGELAVALESHDPRRRALLHVQDGLDSLYAAAGGVDRDRALDSLAVTAGGVRIDRARLGAAFDRIGHKGSAKFRARLANAFDEVAA